MKNRTAKSINFTVFTYFSGQCNNVGLIHALSPVNFVPEAVKLSCKVLIDFSEVQTHFTLKTQQ